MNRVFQQIMSVLLAVILLFAVSGHQLLYHICNHHGIHNVTFSFFIEESINHCTCFGCHHHEEMCSDDAFHVCGHHQISDKVTLTDEDSCCDIVSKLLKITNPFYDKQKILLPVITVIHLGTIFTGISISEIIHPFFNHQIWDDLPNLRFSDIFQKNFLFTQFLF
ncbi:MAG: hypothetical protein PHR53_05480 [Bacteroidales bacterium]|nr:hypothetical protein [Bacteroidales bacterium]